MGKFPREVLNEIKFRYGGLNDTEIHYTNRGSPNDTAQVNGGRIVRIERGFLILSNIPYDTYIPFHRIRKIIYKGEIIFDR